jgi:hypothetical protein
MFIYTLHHEALQTSLHEVKDVVARIGKPVNGGTQPSAVQRGPLSIFCDRVLANPLKDKMFRSFLPAWNNIQNLKHVACASHMQIWIDRQYMMLATGFAWNWLQENCEATYKLQEEESQSLEMEWITQVIRRIMSHFLVCF